jgi:hypothetical protein
VTRRTPEIYAFIDAHPQPTTPEEALAHVVAAYADAPDDRLMIEATRNIYGDGVVTGLAMGDLRTLLERLQRHGDL